MTSRLPAPIPDDIPALASVRDWDKYSIYPRDFHAVAAHLRTLAAYLDRRGKIVSREQQKAEGIGVDAPTLLRFKTEAERHYRKLPQLWRWKD